MKGFLERVKTAIPAHLRFIAIVFILQVLLFSVLRLIILLLHTDDLANIPAVIVLQALVMGARFDACISGYVLAIPLLLLTLEQLLPSRVPPLVRFCQAFIVVVFSAAFLIATIGIPYYGFFHTPLTVSVLDWIESPGFILRMVFSTLKYYPFLFLFLAGVTGYALLIIRWGRPLVSGGWGRRGQRTWRSLGRCALLSLVAIALTFLAMRGRIAAKSPMRWGTAYFSPYTFPNHLALNQVFTFMQSSFEAMREENRELHLMPDDEALQRARSALRVPDPPQYDSPIARRVEPDGPPVRSNVVLVLMESMAAWKMGRYGHPEHRTPVLDSLARTGVVFDNFYTLGTHTFNGIYSTLFGLPSRLSRHPMKQTESIQTYTGIGRALADNGYETIYICTHDAEFDNMAGFLSNSGFSHVVSEKDYPRSKVESVLGVPDHVMFEEAVPRLRTLAAGGAPFLAVFLTASDHVPYVIPEEASPFIHDGPPEHRIVEYADWSIGRFMQLAAREPWYANTIFLFAADHGAAETSPYEISLGYHHAPLIIYSSVMVRTPRAMTQLGEQVDIPPTILGLLHIPYVNNMLGVDLFRERRPFAFFNDDDLIGCLNEEWYLVRSKEGRETLHRRRDGTPADHRREFTATADSMSAYARAMYQTSQWMITHRKAGPPARLP